MAEGKFDFNEWLASAKEDPKVAAQPLIIVALIALLAWRFGYQPQKKLLEKELRKHKGIKSEIQGLKSAVENIEEIKVEVADLKKSWAFVEEKCYQKEEGPLFIQDLRNIGKQAELNFRTITPLPPESRTFESLTYDLYPVKIAFQGTIKQLGIFLRLIEKHKKVIFLDLPSLEPDASGTFKFDLVPTTILLTGRLAPPPPQE